LWIRRASRWGTLRLEIALPVILEAAIYALTLGAAVSLVLDRLLGLGLDARSVVGALGAGVIRSTLTTYTPAWLVAGAICLIAALVVLRIGRRAASAVMAGEGTGPVVSSQLEIT